MITFGSNVLFLLETMPCEHPSSITSGRVVTAQNTAGEVSIGVTVVLAQQVLFECSLVDSGTQVLHYSAQIDFGVFQAGSAAW